MALVLTIKDGEPLQIGGATVVITRRSNGTSKVAITAPQSVQIQRPGVTDKRNHTNTIPPEAA